MYTTYFGFREKPFNITPDPRFFYENPVYQEAYASLLYGIRERKGFIVLTGEVGTGKTTLLRRLMSNLEEPIHFVYFYNTNLAFDELLNFICDDFGLQADQKGRLQQIQALNEFLLARLQEGGTGVLLIDEAQNLKDDVLENLRLLSNLETSTEKLLQIVLVGQPELEGKLAHPRLRQLRQRIAIWCHLGFLQEREIRLFLLHRLRLAGCERQDLFSPEAIQRIAFYSKGIPRLINILCDNAFLIAYSTDQNRVSARIIEEVARDLQLDPKLPLRQPDASVWGTPPTSVVDAQERGTELGAPDSTPQQFFENQSRPWPRGGIKGGEADSKRVGLNGQLENASAPISHWAVQQRSPSRIRWVRVVLALLCLGVAGAFFYPRQAADYFFALKHTVGKVLEGAKERFTSLRQDPYGQLKGPAPEEEGQRKGEDLMALAQMGSQTQFKTQLAADLDGQSFNRQGEKPKIGPHTLPSAAETEMLGREQKRHVAALRPDDTWKGKRIVVQRGTTLSKIVLDVYGSYNILAMDLIKEMNPHIDDINWIIEGAELWLPPLTREGLLREQEDGSYQLIVGSFRHASEAEQLARTARRRGYAVEITPQEVSRSLILHRVWIKGLANLDAVERAWDLVTIKNPLFPASSPGTQGEVAGAVELLH